MKYFIDTNIFLRTLIGDVKDQRLDCIKLLKAVKQNKIEAYTNTVVLTEIVWTLSSYYGFSKRKIIKGVRSILNLRGLKLIDDYNHLQTLKLYESPKVKYIDALIASNYDIQNHQMTIVSYDKDFDKLPVLKKEPNEVKIE